ncbi:MAG: calcium-binding protein [Symploca sp. SIO3C6]|uniref:Calcium-binding protein n=1 Tax=Symploca sp. SIO1C4 TaxID=2607765 RepID=A0A6B3N4K8_9CYAN|nr:calcium-binding protein [Symploca sp. SIO3C6]NER26470.1 calcium-binding protein [Symploca sp. SIO1C4]NET03650.1 calcium-binding protein [Symploca sp. SIO2B6]
MGDVIIGGANNDNLIGSNGDDLIRGGDGDDTMRGGNGDDTLIGDRGSDLFLGGWGNDRFIWNDGDGSDVMEGDQDFDVTEFNGAVNAGDELLLESNGVRASFQRLNLGQITLDVDNVEQFEINGLGGDDTLTVKDLSPTDVIKVVFNGGDGNDSLDASQTNVDILAIGGDGSDTLIGGSGNDTIVGGSLEDFGQGEIDYMSGSGGANTYVLGDSQSMYYNYQGDSDYAWISDYTAGWDSIQLQGGVSYQWQDTTIGSVSGAAVYYNNDMIGFVEGHTSDAVQVNYV